MQIPENPNNNDIREALMQLSQQIQEVNHQVAHLGDNVKQLDYKFDAYQKGTDGMVRMANTIIIATASVVILAGFSPAVNAIITALFATNQP